MISTITERARAVIPGVNRDAKKLADALSEIRKREARRCEIEAQFRKRAGVDYFVEKLARANQKYEQSQSDEDLEAVCLVECLLEKARRRAGLAQMQITYGVVDTQFRTEFGDENNRELLTRACSLRLKVLQAEYQRITVTTERRLSAEGFTADEIAKWPSIKQAKDTIARFTSLLEHLPARQPEDIWKVASYIFSEE
jgi:hypothetical protein